MLAVCTFATITLLESTNCWVTEEPDGWFVPELVGSKFGSVFVGVIPGLPPLRKRGLPGAVPSRSRHVFWLCE